MYISWTTINHNFFFNRCEGSWNNFDVTNKCFPCHWWPSYFLPKIFKYSLWLDGILMNSKKKKALSKRALRVIMIIDFLGCVFISSMLLLSARGQGWCLGVDDGPREPCTLLQGPRIIWSNFTPNPLHPIAAGYFLKRH